MLKIRFVCATKMNGRDFHDKALLGRCLKLYGGLFELDLYESNSLGLPLVYNASIEKSKLDPAILVFVHDDIYLMDFWWNMQIREALKHFQIVGVAGNSRRLPNQPTWIHSDLAMNFDYENISGCVGFGDGVGLPERLYISGPVPRSAKILDGVFLACYSETLVKNAIKFDEKFAFHYYDMDFCRQADEKGVTMGTWQISILHQSLGLMDDAWRESQIKYFEKWGN